MKIQLQIILYCVVFATTLIAGNGVGIQVSNEGLIEKIIPFYTEPTLRLEEESNDIEDTIFASNETNEESLSIRDGNFLKEDTDYDLEVSRLNSYPPKIGPIFKVESHHRNR